MTAESLYISTVNPELIADHLQSSTQPGELSLSDPEEPERQRLFSCHRIILVNPTTHLETLLVMVPVKRLVYTSQELDRPVESTSNDPVNSIIQADGISQVFLSNDNGLNLVKFRSYQTQYDYNLSVYQNGRVISLFNKLSR
jgi:hypothetical protein